jgi:hypothetical protein
MELPQEYWLERTLLEIAGAIGTPLLIDTTSQKHVFVHYAHVLVYIDFSRRLFYEIMVEREGFVFPVEVAYDMNNSALIVKSFDTMYRLAVWWTPHNLLRWKKESKLRLCRSLFRSGSTKRSPIRME